MLQSSHTLSVESGCMSITQTINSGFGEHKEQQIFENKSSQRFEDYIEDTPRKTRDLKKSKTVQDDEYRKLNYERNFFDENSRELEENPGISISPDDGKKIPDNIRINLSDENPQSGGGYTDYNPYMNKSYDQKKKLTPDHQFVSNTNKTFNKQPTPMPEGCYGSSTKVNPHTQNFSSNSLTLTLTVPSITDKEFNTNNQNLPTSNDKDNNRVESRKKSSTSVENKLQKQLETIFECPEVFDENNLGSDSQKDRNWSHFKPPSVLSRNSADKLKSCQ